MKTTEDLHQPHPLFPSAMRRDSTLSTNNIKRERLESPRRATGRTVGQLTEIERGILWGLVLTRVMKRDQIKELWYRDATIRVVNWRLQSLKEKKLITTLPQGPMWQNVWTFTGRGLGALQEELAREGLSLAIDPPAHRKIEPMSVMWQIALADLFVGVIKREKQSMQLDAFANVRWQLGKRQGVPFYYALKTEFFKPDLYFGTRKIRSWFAYVHVERGHEKTRHLRRMFETCARYDVIVHPRREPSTLIYICPNKERCAFARRIFQTLESAWRSTFKAVTPEESGPILKRYLAYGTFFGNLREKVKAPSIASV